MERSRRVRPYLAGEAPYPAPIPRRQASGASRGACAASTPRASGVVASKYGSIRGNTPPMSGPELVVGRAEEAGQDHAQRPARRLRAEDLDGSALDIPVRRRPRGAEALRHQRVRRHARNPGRAAARLPRPDRAREGRPVHSLGLPRGRRSGARRRRSRVRVASLPIPQRAATDRRLRAVNRRRRRCPAGCPPPRDA